MQVLRKNNKLITLATVLEIYEGTTYLILQYSWSTTLVCSINTFSQLLRYWKFKDNKM